MAKGFGQYVESSSKRVNTLKEKLIRYGYTNPDDIMMTIMEVFREGEFVPDVGKYYTFIYSAKTKGVTYDEFPLVAIRIPPYPQEDYSSQFFVEYETFILVFYLFSPEFCILK